MRTVMRVYVSAIAALLALSTASARDQVSDRARALHQDALVFDAHVHVVNRQFYHGGDMGQRVEDGQFDLARARDGGLDAMFFSPKKSTCWWRPSFRWVGLPAPEEIKFTPYEWLAVVDRAIEMVGEDHVMLGSDFDGAPTLPRVCCSALVLTH